MSCKVPRNKSGPKIREEQLEEVYKLLRDGRKQEEIASLFGVTHSCISYIKRKVLPNYFPKDTTLLTCYGMKSPEERLKNRRKYHREYHKKKKEMCVEYSVMRNIRRVFYRFVKKTKKLSHARDFIGCTKEELLKYLESKFSEGMSWENYGRKGWHIDHIIPCSFFDLTDTEQQKKCFHYTNLQPLWWDDNLRKSNKLVDERVII